MSYCERHENQYIVRAHAKITEWGRLGARKPSGAFERRGISSQYADRAGLRMTLMVRTCRMFRRHFLMPNAKSGSCEKRARTTIRLW